MEPNRIPQRPNGHDTGRRGIAVTTDACPYCGAPLSAKTHREIRARLAQEEAARLARHDQQLRVQFDREKKRLETMAQAAIEKANSDAAKAAEVRLKAIRDHQTGVVAAAVEAERARSEKAVSAAVEAAKLEYASEKVRLEGALADALRKLQSKTPFDRGEPAEVSLADAIAAVLPPSDVVRRVEKGRPGVDVVIEVVHGNAVVGKIVIDSKAHAKWQNAFCRKLRSDQLREDAAFGILSTSVMPKGASQLHAQDGVIVCHPDRVPVLVVLLRKIVVDNHVQKRGTEARNRKAEAALKFLLSRDADDLLEKLVARTRSLAALDATEMKSHESTWTKRATLLGDVLEVHTEFTAAISGIIAGERQ